MVAKLFSCRSLTFSPSFWPCKKLTLKSLGELSILVHYDFHENMTLWEVKGMHCAYWLVCETLIDSHNLRPSPHPSNPKLSY